MITYSYEIKGRPVEIKFSNTRWAYMFGLIVKGGVSEIESLKQNAFVPKFFKFALEQGILSSGTIVNVPSFTEPPKQYLNELRKLNLQPRSALSVILNTAQETNYEMTFWSETCFHFGSADLHKIQENIK